VVSLLILERAIESNKGVCPIKLFDYWAAGLPVIAVPFGEVQPMGNDGFYFAQGIDEWKQALISIHSHPDRAQFVGATGQRILQRSHLYPYLIEVIRTAL
jgi:glycosyltransferase involved in cell wall biosynthesis